MYLLYPTHFYVHPNIFTYMYVHFAVRTYLYSPVIYLHISTHRYIYPRVPTCTYDYIRDSYLPSTILPLHKSSAIAFDRRWLTILCRCYWRSLSVASVFLIVLVRMLLQCVYFLYGYYTYFLMLLFVCVLFDRTCIAVCVCCCAWTSYLLSLRLFPGDLLQPARTLAFHHVIGARLVCIGPVTCCVLTEQ